MFRPLPSLLLLLAPTAHAGVLHVADDAPIGGDGSPSAPYHSVAEALYHAEVGDTLLLAPGEYLVQGRTLYTPDLTIAGSARDETTLRFVGPGGLTNRIDGTWTDWGVPFALQDLTIACDETGFEALDIYGADVTLARVGVTGCGSFARVEDATLSATGLHIAPGGVAYTGFVGGTVELLHSEVHGGQVALGSVDQLLLEDSTTSGPLQVGDLSMRGGVHTGALQATRVEVTDATVHGDVTGSVHLYRATVEGDVTGLTTADRATLIGDVDAFDLHMERSWVQGDLSLRLGSLIMNSVLQTDGGSLRLDLGYHELIHVSLFRRGATRTAPAIDCTSQLPVDFRLANSAVWGFDSWQDRHTVGTCQGSTTGSVLHAPRRVSATRRPGGRPAWGGPAFDIADDGGIQVLDGQSLLDSAPDPGLYGLDTDLYGNPRNFPADPGPVERPKRIADHPIVVHPCPKCTKR